MYRQFNSKSKEGRGDWGFESEKEIEGKGGVRVGVGPSPLSYNISFTDVIRGPDVLRYLLSGAFHKYCPWGAVRRVKSGKPIGNVKGPVS